MSRSGYKLRPFDPLYAPTVVSWAPSLKELHWLAPGTPPPLTAAKVVGWTKTRGNAQLLFANESPLPCGYGEINPMRDDSRHFWLGHVLVDPTMRQRGLGRLLTGLLTDLAWSQMNAQRISLVVFPENTAAVRCYLGCGFQSRGEEYHRFAQQSQPCRLLRLEMCRQDALDPPRAAFAPAPADSAEM